MNLVPLPPPSPSAEQEQKRLAELDAEFRNRVAVEIGLPLDERRLEIIIDVLAKFRAAEHVRRSRVSKKDLDRLMNTLHSNLSATKATILSLPPELYYSIEESFETEWFERIDLRNLGFQCWWLEKTVDRLQRNPSLFESTFLQSPRKKGEKGTPHVEDFIMRAAEIFSSIEPRPSISFHDVDSAPRESRFKAFLEELWKYCWETPERWIGTHFWFDKDWLPCKRAALLRRAKNALSEFRSRNNLHQRASASRQRRAKKSAS